MAERVPESSAWQRTPKEVEVRLARDPHATLEVPELRMHELKGLFDRLGDCVKGNNWKLLFAVATQLLAGGAIGAAVSGDAPRNTVLVVFGFAALCGLAWLAVRDTEADSVAKIHKAFGDVLDSFEEVEVPATERGRET